MLALPRDVADLVYGSLWIFLPWPAAIGYRRFIHGVMIISGQTRQVAVGTIFRLATMAGTAYGLFALLTDLHGRMGGRGQPHGGRVRRGAGGAADGCAARSAAHPGDDPGPEWCFAAAQLVRPWSSFYYPLALTSLVALATHPVLTFLVGRARAPLESLAVLPVIHSLSFLFRAVGLSYQEAAIALDGQGSWRHRRSRSPASRWGLRSSPLRGTRSSP